MKHEFNITTIAEGDKDLISKYIAGSWGFVLSVSRGTIHDTSALPGFICKESGRIKGLITYNIKEDECEIVTLNSELQNKGLGEMLINKVVEVAKENRCKRVWLITTNDNVKAIRYYQKRGFEWAAFHKDAMKESRKLKPQIPEFGNDDIPIKHEIEFELFL